MRTLSANGLEEWEEKIQIRMEKYVDVGNNFRILATNILQIGDWGKILIQLLTHSSATQFKSFR